MGSLYTLSGGLCRFRRFRKGADGSFTAGCGGFTNGSRPRDGLREWQVLSLLHGAWSGSDDFYRPPALDPESAGCIEG